MSGKTFHVRANEVRAEAQALMQKLRAERFATSRAGKRAIRLKTEQVVAVAPPLLAPVKPDRIIVSRKINAAVVREVALPEVAPLEIMLPKAEPTDLAQTIDAPTLVDESPVDAPLAKASRGVRHRVGK
ncbi:MAG: hypothetical protein ACRC7G_17745, partial [Beijerinckiaceae bacterium]